MTIERYVIRRADGGPDLVWIAELDFDAAADRGELRHAGGLEGQVDAIPDRTACERIIDDYRRDGCEVDRLP